MNLDQVAKELSRLVNNANRRDKVLSFSTLACLSELYHEVVILRALVQAALDVERQGQGLNAEVKP